MIQYVKLIFVVVFLLFTKNSFAQDRYFTWFDLGTHFRIRINIETYELQTEILSWIIINYASLLISNSVNVSVLFLNFIIVQTL
jgi:hypothetical protein